MKRVALALALVAAALVTRPLPVSTQTDPALVGQWSGVRTWPAIAVHSHLLNSGKVLTWETGAQATIWDPASGLFTAVPDPWVDLLCSGHTFLADGRLLVLGGWDRSGTGLGLNEADIFEPNIQAWIRARPMAFKRWYPTATSLPDGKVIVVSGARNSLTDIVQVPEVYDPATDTWTSLTAATRAIPMYPFLFVLPDGRVISVGNSEVPTRTQALDLDTLTWTVIDSRSLEGGAAVMYGPGKFMKAGSSADSGDPGLSVSTAFTLDMSEAAPLWKPTGSMAFPRSFLNLTTLPDGSVLATGGGTDRSAFNTANGVLAAELWSPSKGTWTTLASAARPRLYHSTAQLLADGRVLVGGGGADSGVTDQVSTEIFSPPYLFKGPRPTIASTPSTLSYGTNFTVATPDAANIASVALIAPGSVTHAFNHNQRFMNLNFSVTPSGLNVTAPANANFAPPGYYMLFIVNSNGVPSIASWVNFPVGAAPALVAVPSVVNTTQAAAASAIANAGLTVGAITTATSTTVPSGSVISQNPVAGTQVTPGSAVSLVVSSGAALVTVPNVVNSPQAAATSAITGVGLTLGSVTNAASTTVPAGSVISQSPIAGSQVAAGSAVSLVVSSGATLVTVPNVVNSPQAAATSAITGVGLTVGAVTTSASATVPSGSVISQNPAGGAQVAPGTAVALVVSSGPSAALTVDTTVFIDGKGTVVTPPFNTAAAGELLVAFGSSDGPTSGGQRLTITGAGLTWTLKQRGNTQLGTSEVWTATAPSALVNATVTAQQLTGGFDQSLTVVAFRGAGGTGASASAGALSGAPTVSLTTTRAGSLVYGVGNDWNAAIGRTLGANQTMVHQWIDTAVGDTFWVQSRTGAVASSGTLVTINDTAPTGDQWNFTAVEIIASTQAQIATPNVVGQTQAAATVAITSAGLTLGGVTTASSTTVPSGSVISQSPAAGTQVAGGSAVSIVVSSGPPQVATPNVVGQTQAAATAAISGAGLTLGTVTTASSTTVPAGSVISQTPAAGTQVAINSAVSIVVSSGLPQVATPNVVGQTQAAATAAISGAGLTLGTVTTASSTTVPAGSVISQNPAAGTQVAVNSAVSIVVSSGPPQVAAPNLVGQTQGAATTLIANAGLALGTVTTASSTTVPSGTVMSQSPAAGTQVTVGSAIAIVVSTGLPQVATPNVVGQTQAAATSAITGAGLTLGTVTTASSTTVPSGSVISQVPTAGTQVATGTAVALVVSSGLPQVATPNVVGQTQAAATTAITGAGLTLGTVTTASSTTVPAGSVISQTPAAGTQVAINSAVSLVVSSGLPQVPAPNVVGRTQPAAITVITTAGLTVGAITSAPSTTVPAGTVISQDPAAGTQVATGSAVSLVVSSGVPQVTTPNVVGQTQAAATAAITSAGLSVGAITTSPSTTIPAGSVISQNPAAGAQVPSGSAVSLVVSSGLPLVATPSVVGQTQAAATAAITGAGLSVGAITTASSTTVAAGLVITQTPAGGTQVASGSAVALVISTGAPAPSVFTVDAVVSIDGTGSVVAPAFSTTGANELLVAFVSSDGPSSGPQTVVVSSSGLTWTLKERANTQFGSSEIWTAVAAAPLTNALVSSEQAQCCFDQSMTVVAFKGAAGTGASVHGGATTGLPSVSLTTTRAGSLVYGAGNDWTSATSRALGRNQTMVHEWVDFGMGTFWVQAIAGPVAEAGTIATIDDIAPTTDRWNLAAIEILDAGAPATVTVPNVVGTTQAAAASAIAAAGLTSSVTTAPSATVPAGIVIEQTPAAGTALAPGSEVTLVVSSGTLTVTTPNVVGQTQTAATTTITTAGLTVGTVTSASSSTVPAGSVISQSPAAGTPIAAGSAISLVISSGAPVSLSVDKVVFSDGAGTRTTPAFNTTKPGELLIAFASAAGPTSTSIKQSLTVSGAGLSWTLVRRSNAQFGSAEVWSAVAPAVLTNATVTASSTLAGFDQSLTVVAFIGAAGTGASSAASASFGATTVSLVTTAPGSLVYGVGNDSARAALRTLGPNQTMTHQWLDTIANQTFWVQSITTPVANTGTTATINDTAPTSDRWNVAAVEILAATLAPPPVTVPNIVGQTQAAAATSLTSSGLTVGAVITASSTTVPAGAVISQNPAAGTQVASGAAVDLVVSSGVPQVAAPNVVGLTQAAATAAIVNAGLTSGPVTTASSTTVPSGSVISQNPAAGTQVATGSAVSVVVSSGPPQVTTPNVVGLTQAAATTAIGGAGLTVGAVTTASSATVPAGSVISQTPAGGVQVTAGSAVAMVVSSGLPGVAAPAVVGMTQDDATIEIEAVGLAVGAVTAVSSETVPAGIVMAQSPVADTLLLPGATVDLTVSSGPSFAVDRIVVSEGIGTRVTTPFSTAAADEVLVAFVASNGPNSTVRQSATVSGAGLSWTLVRRANAQFGTAEVWTATASSQLVNATVVATQSVTGSYDMQLVVVAFKGAAGVGAAIAGGGNNTAPSVTLTTTVDGSSVWGVGFDADRNIARTLGSGQTMIRQMLDNNDKLTLWVQARSTAIANAGTPVTINDTAPDFDRWNMVAVEIVPR